MTSASKLLQVARKELGTKEKPAGSNKVKYTRWYGMTGPWCAMYVSYCANKAGIPTTVIPKHAYTPSGKAWFKARGQWGSTPKVGAIVYYNLSGLGRVSHVGIVEKVFSDGSWYALEGNTDERGGRTGGKVMRKHRFSVGVGGGFGYPKYGGKSSAPKSTPTYKPVKHGQMLQRYVKGAPVGDVQRFLGLNVDNAYGDATYKAVKAWQKKTKGLEADGIVGPASWKAMKKAGLKSTAAKKKAPVKFPLSAGHWYGQKVRTSRAHSGVVARDRPWIREIQKRVGVKQDGIFGANTARAVARWQKKHKLTEDSAVGAKTFKKMFG